MHKIELHLPHTFCKKIETLLSPLNIVIYLVLALCRTRFSRPHLQHLAQSVSSCTLLDRYFSSLCSAPGPRTWPVCRALHHTIQAHTFPMAGYGRALAWSFHGSLPAFHSRNGLDRSFTGCLYNLRRLWDATSVKSLLKKLIKCYPKRWG